MHYQNSPGEQLFSNFNALKKSIFRFFSAQADKFSGLKQSEIFMLMRIAHNRRDNGAEIRISDLSRLSHSSMPAVSQTIRSLEAAGFVLRVTSDKDRRAVFVKLTPKGQDFVSAAPQAFTKTFNEICAALGREKTAQLIAITGELCGIVDDFTASLNAATNTDKKGKDHDKTSKIS